MISIETVVRIFLYIMGCGLIFGILYWILATINPPEPWFKFGKIFLVVCAGLIAIGIILDFMGHPIIRFQ